MDSVMTQWAFGFGGWIGAFGGFFLFLNVPHNYTALLLPLSPWLGGISLYLLMFATFSWMNVCVQVTGAMLKQEIVVAVLTSFMGVMIVAIARMIIEMERGHRTPAQAAAEESAAEEATTAALPPSPPSEPETTQTAANDEESSDSDGDTSSEESDDNEESGEESGDDEEDEESSADSGENADSESSLNKARTDSSYENIQTPQLSAMKPEQTSPIPTIADV